jgi:predicted Zn-dependent protease
MKINKWLYNKSVIFLVVISLMLSPPPFLLPNALAISVEDEQKKGEEVALYGQYTDAVLDNGFVRQYFNELGRYLIRPVETKHFNFHFYIINDKTVNAFATFAGHIFFYTGLINIMDSLDELAAVLCHEISHVAARHISKGMDRQKKIMIAQLAGVLAGALIGGEAAAPLIFGSQAAGMQAQINYTRDNERQADQMGFEYMKASGFDPRAMITVLKKFEQLKRMSPYVDKIPPYIMTHPTDSERMANNDSMLQSYTPMTPGEEVKRFRELFPFFQAVIRAKGLAPNTAQNTFFRELAKNPDSVPSYFGLGIVYTGTQEYEKAIAHLERALKLKPDFAPVLTSLGKAYQRNGEDEKALIVLKKAKALNEEDNSIRFLMGVSYENLEQYDEAIRIFKRLTYFEPIESGTYYHLGISYGRQNKLVLAHYNFGICYKRWRNFKKADFHFNKAYQLAEDDPRMREKIKKELDELYRNHPRQREKEE